MLDNKPSKFLFQIGYSPAIRDSDEMREECFIDQCPTLLITDFTLSMWQKYNDMKAKKEMGYDMGYSGLRKLHFDAFKVFMRSGQEHDDYKAAKKKNKGSNAPKGLKGGRNSVRR